MSPLQSFGPESRNASLPKHCVTLVRAAAKEARSRSGVHLNFILEDETKVKTEQRPLKHWIKEGKAN